VLQDQIRFQRSGWVDLSDDEVAEYGQMKSATLSCWSA
jgi:hypothetical protein